MFDDLIDIFRKMTREEYLSLPKYKDYEGDGMFQHSIVAFLPDVGIIINVKDGDYSVDFVKLV